MASSLTDWGGAAGGPRAASLRRRAAGRPGRTPGLREPSWSVAGRRRAGLAAGLWVRSPTPPLGDTRGRRPALSGPSRRSRELSRCRAQYGEVLFDSFFFFFFNKGSSNKGKHVSSRLPGWRRACARVSGGQRGVGATPGMPRLTPERAASRDRDRRWLRARQRDWKRQEPALPRSPRVRLLRVDDERSKCD